MTRLSLTIASAHISTYGERVVDVFYVKDVFGLKVEHERKIKEIREALTAALKEPGICDPVSVTRPQQAAAH
jgi:[protein-PII] uridylyltransferase